MIGRGNLKNLGREKKEEGLEMAREKIGSLEERDLSLEAYGMEEEYLQKALLEQRTCRVLGLRFLRCNLEPHFGHLPRLREDLGEGIEPGRNWHLQSLQRNFCLPDLGCLPNLTRFFERHLGQVSSFIVGLLSFSRREVGLPSDFSLFLNIK
jgi:hypothetical protein